jgi:hypothetical protein
LSLGEYKKLETSDETFYCKDSINRLPIFSDSFFEGDHDDNDLSALLVNNYHDEATPISSGLGNISSVTSHTLQLAIWTADAIRNSDHISNGE